MVGTIPRSRLVVEKYELLYYNNNDHYIVGYTKQNVDIKIMRK
jgi:hypothetical protein